MATDPAASQVPQVGEPVEATTPDQVSDGLGSLAQVARRKELTGASRAMYVIGFLTVVVNLGLASFAEPLVDIQFEKELKELENQNLQVDPAKLAELKRGAVLATRLSGFGFALVGALFFVLGTLVYWSPVPCTVLALVLYLGGAAISAWLDPSTLLQGAVVKIIIIVALMNGIRAAIAYERQGAAA